MENEDISRLKTYKVINNDFTLPKYLGLPYQLRKVIEKGRQKNPKIPREERLCKLCDEGTVEDENHFLLNCTTYTYFRNHYQMNFQNISDMINMDDQRKLAQFLNSAFELRERLLWGRRRD